MHFHLGKVFISHTAADKPFVRRLAARLEKSQFHVWLDEHDLIAGDPLPETIGKALQAAKVILVVVSEASVASKWLRYELNVATERMIKGECRVIPIVIDQTALPARSAWSSLRRLPEGTSVGHALYSHGARARSPSSRHGT